MTEPYPNRWTVLAVVTLVSFITNVDGTIVVIGLPKIMEELHMTVVTGLWSITSYLITSTVFLLPAGKWADGVGTKRIFLWGLAIFTVATILCGMANSGATLIAFRFIQGIGAAFALATATPIIVCTFKASELGLAVGINSTSWIVGSIVGPVAGGVLISELGWRFIFFVTVPFALIGIIGAWIVLPEAEDRKEIRTDWGGMFTFGLGLVALLVALSEGPDFGFSSISILGLFVATFIFWIAFIMIELRITHPLFHFGLLSNGYYLVGLGITLVYCIGYFATTFLLTFYLQGALHLSPLNAGLLLIPLSLPQLILSPFGGAMADRFGPARLILIGLAFLIVGSLLLGHLGAHLSIFAIIFPLFLMSAANSFSWPSLVKAVFSATPREQTGAASGMFYTIRNIGMLLSQIIALMVAEFSIPKAVAQKAFLGTLGVQNSSVIRALVHSTDVGFRVFCIFFDIALLLGVILLLPRRVKTA